MGDFYEGRVFRPPSEARSLIIQSTIGCSHNRCAFCEMYKDKRFRIRSVDEVTADLITARRYIDYARRIFFADGDAFARSASSNIAILDEVRRIFPECERVSMYASPKSVLKKTQEELIRLRASGIKLVYIGLETGDEALLKRINKGVTARDTVNAVLRLREAGFLVSVTAILGLAGGESMAHSAPCSPKEHALATARAVSAMKPDYFSLLSLMLEAGSDMYEDFRAGRFIPATPREMLIETKLILESTDSEGTVFRSNHASNYLDLRGTLNRDSARMLLEIDSALSGKRTIKSEGMRAL